MGSSIIAALGLAFLAGILSILSPCVLLLLPIVLGAAASEHRLGPALLAGGVAASFVVEQDHRAVKRVARPMLGSKSFRSTAATLGGIKLMHMIRNGQLRATDKLRRAQQFYSLAG